MTEQEIYRALAERLDELPNGFAQSETDSDLRLLAKIFSPDEAGVASQMHADAEPVSAIAARVDMEVADAKRLLKGMVRKGLIRAEKGQRQLNYGLIPWVVGIYENQLPRMDAELAGLFEEYYLETTGMASALRESPAVHRVVPVREAIPFELGIYPHETASSLIEGAKSWAVRDCICRVQQKLVGKGCERPVENCLVFAPVENVFQHSEVDRSIPKDEALRILSEAHDAGLVHSTGNYRDGNTYICNCCTCCCGVLRAVADHRVPSAVANSAFAATVLDSECVGCGACTERCQCSALAIVGDLSHVDIGRCVGCGVCVSTCPAEAIHLERRDGEDVPELPADHAAWDTARAGSR